MCQRKPNQNQVILQRRFGFSGPGRDLDNFENGHRKQQSIDAKPIRDKVLSVAWRA